MSVTGRHNALVLKVKSEFEGQIVPKFDLGLLNAYKLMYFNKNVNGDKDDEFLGGYY